MKGNKHDGILQSRRERVMSFFYVSFFFLITAASCCLLIYWANSDYHSTNQKVSVITKINKVKQYRNAQELNRANVDSLFNRIMTYEPGINARYIEDDIVYMLNDLRNIYQNNIWDNRYRAFLHVADFYQMWLVDRKELWSRKQNIANFRVNLEACEIGLESKKQDLRSNVKK